MELLYWGEDSTFAYLRQQTTAYLTRFPQTTLSVRRVDHPDALDAEQTPLCVVSDRQLAVSAHVTVLIHDEPSQQPSVAAQHWQLVRGSNDEINFAQLIRHIALRAEQTLVHHSISTPMAHDLRGALGVVALSAELLRSREGFDKIVQKLLSARIKAETLVNELQVVSSPHFFNQLATTERIEGQASARSLNDVLQETAAWFSAAHREHQFNLAPMPSSTLAARYSGLILRGVVDTLARLSPVPSAVSISELSNRKLQITWETPLAPDHQQALEQGLSPDCLSPEPGKGLPFRWWLCLYAARADKSKLSLDCSNGPSMLTYEY